jgi:2-polyprenyl-3-methyl-5-hydroxy-6-metoxy-1,4-benzoquinol methylase
MILSAHSLYDFGELASDYERWYDTPAGRAHDETQKSDVRKFLKPAKPGARLLDVGCGTGHWSRFFASLGYEVVGVDISEEMIQAAEGRPAPNCCFQVADALALPFGDHGFDVVAAMSVIEFVSDASVALMEMFRCVKADGAVLIGTLNRLAPINRHRLAKGRQPYASGRLLSPSELRRLLIPSGCVRMMASLPKTGRRRHRGWRITARRTLSGPFIVAEVRP